MSLHKEPLDQEDQDAIILDARAGDLDSLKEIFTTLIDPCMLQTCRDSISRSTALHMACGNGHLETAKYILSLIPKDQLKEYINLQNETGNTALHWAALNGHLPIVELLCDEFEADPFIRNSFGHDAIFEAENNGKEEVETYFLKKYDIEPVSEEEDNNNNAESVQVSKGTEIEDVTKEAAEVLSEATEKLNIE